MVILRASYPNYSTLTSQTLLTVEDLDVFEADAPILLDISAIENGEIGDVFGVSSQTFSLPGTDVNNRFFGNLFDLGVTPNVAFQKSVDCQVLIDGAEVFSGKMYITDVITDQKGYTTYQVNIVNETVDLKFKLENTLLQNVDISHLNHAYTYANISASWSDNLFGGDVVYPLVNYGIPVDDTFLPDYALGASDATSRTFDNYDYPLRIQQFRPAVRVKAILDAIFDDIDYKYTSSFIDSDYFNNLYALPTNNEGLGPTTDTTLSGSFWVFSGNTQSFPAITPYTVDYNLTQYDNYFRYDLPNDYYQAYANGYYDFSVQFDYTISNYDLDNRPRFIVKLVNDVTSATLSSKTYIDPPYTGTIYAPFPNVYLSTNTKVRVELEFLSDVGNETVYLAGSPGASGINQCNFKGIGPAASIGGGTVNAALQFPVEDSALDFLQGLIEKFNLVVEPVPNQKNVLRIEPYQDWINQGEVVDWTDKVDRSIRYKIVHPASEQPKYITFRDEDDEAAPNKYTLANFGDVFGTYEYKQLVSDLSEGEREIGSFFAATPVKHIPGGNEVIIPTLGRRDDTGQVRPFKFKPRMLYKNGLKTMPSAQGFDANSVGCYLWEVVNEDFSFGFTGSYVDCSNVSQSVFVDPLQSETVCVIGGGNVVRTGGTNAYAASQVGICPASSSNGTYPGTYWFKDEFGVTHRESEWLQMTPFEYLPTDFSGSISGSRDLHYGNLDNPGWYQYFQPVQNGKTTLDAYHEYWATYVNSLYDIDARKLTCNVFFDPYEIQNIALNQNIFIDGHYYRINRINGANLSYPDTTEVELIKLIPGQLKYPRRRITSGSGADPIDITVGGIAADGRVTYINYNTGEIVEDYAYTSIAGAQDGFTVINVAGSGSVSIQNPNVSFGGGSQTVYGANNVDANSNNVMMAGGNNTVSQQTSNVLVVGENNSIDAGSNNTTALGRNHSTTNTSTNVQFLGGNGNAVANYTYDSTLVGGVFNVISGSSIVSMVGGASNEVRNSPTSRNVTIGGLNSTQDNNQTTTLINTTNQTYVSGSNHTVINSPEARSNNLDNFRNDSVVMGDMYVGGAYFYTPIDIMISQTGSVDLQSPAYAKNYTFFIDWFDDGTGPGDSQIYLPSIFGSANDKSMEGRAFRFKGSGNIPAGGSNEVDIRVSTSDALNGVTIEGASHVSFRFAYDALTLVAHNNQWWILQSRG